MPATKPEGDSAAAPRLIELVADNFQTLQAVTIRPAGQVVEITGPNGSGKTSCLRALWALLKGKAAAPPVTIRKGAEICTLEGDFGAKLKVTRTVTRGDDGEELWALKVVVDGTRRLTTKPQAFLDALVGEGLWLDPLDFTRRDPKAQADVLKRLVPGFDFAEAASLRASLYAERTDVNRDATRAKAAAQAIVLPDGPEPAETDVSALIREMEAATRVNTENAARRERRAQAGRDADAKDEEAERLRARASTLEGEASAIRDKVKTAPAIPPDTDLTDLRTRIDGANETAEARRAFRQRREHLTAANEAETKSAELTQRLDSLEADKARAIAKADLPVPGLAFDDSGVTLNGLPFAQASTAEKIRAAMAIAMATAGDLKLVMIDEGSELDSKSLSVIEHMVDGTPFVVLICKVDESGERGFVLEDGRLVHTPASPKPKAAKK